MVNKHLNNVCAKQFKSRTLVNREYGFFISDVIILFIAYTFQRLANRESFAKCCAIRLSASDVYRKLTRFNDTASVIQNKLHVPRTQCKGCLLYTSDAADD